VDACQFFFLHLHLSLAHTLTYMHVHTHTHTHACTHVCAHTYTRLEMRFITIVIHSTCRKEEEDQNSWVCGEVKNVVYDRPHQVIPQLTVPAGPTERAKTPLDTLRRFLTAAPLETILKQTQIEA